MQLSNLGQPTKEYGFSLVELMVAMVLGLLLTAAVLQMFMSAKRTYEFQQELSRIQENGRFAMEFLTRDIRGTDFGGCLNYADTKSNLAGDLDPDLFAAGLIGRDGVPGTTTGYDPVLGPDADAIVLQGGRGGGIGVVQTGSSTANSAQIKLDKIDHPIGQTIRTGDILLVSDCTNAEIFQVSNVRRANRTVVHNANTGVLPGNKDNFLDDFYGDGAQVFMGGGIRYWLRTGTGGEPVLVRGSERDGWSGGDELVEGVSNLQILYGEDTSGDGSPNYFVPAHQVADMRGVVSVQIHLLLQSLRDNLIDRATAINYYGMNRMANDRRLRKVFVSTIALRNRLD